MPASGGNTTQSGIIFQNSIAALCLGRMLIRDRPDTDRPVEVRVEAPTAVDDTVVRFIDGHRGFIQAKERIQTGSEDWKTLWRHFEEQCSYPDFAAEDRLILWLGEDNSQSKGLRDICKQAAGATGYEEWYGGLSKGKQEQAEKVRVLLEKQENETLFALLKQVDIETARSLEEIERDLVPSWLPECNDQGGLFRSLRDICGGHARYSKVIKPDCLLRELPDEWRIALKALAIRTGSTVGGPLGTLGLAAAEDAYRQRLVAVYGRLSFSGFERGDLSLPEVPLEKVFIRLSLTEEKGKQEGGAERPRPRAADRWVRRRREPEQEGRAKGQESVEKTQKPVELVAALSKNVLIVGEPGAGKSTLLRWLAVTFALRRQCEENRLGPQADADLLPVLVELGRLPEQYLKPDAREMPNWLAFLPEEIRRQLFLRQVSVDDIPPELFQNALSEGRCLLMFDGLDEVAAGAIRRSLAESLSEFGRMYPKIRIVIASRPAGVSEAETVLSPQFQRCQIKRLTPPEVKAFFGTWYELDQALPVTDRQAAVDHLFEQLQANPGAQSLATTPLLATMLLLIWRNEGTLPTRRVDLYNRCCKQLIENWEAGHRIAYQGALADLGWERHLRLLAPLAYAIHSQGQRTGAAKEDLVPLLALALQHEGLCMNATHANSEAEQFLASLGLRSGLLQHVGGGQYGFPHQTFQEYLAARHIGSQEYPEELFMPHLHEAWWREVHLLTIGHLASNAEGGKKASELIKAILKVYPPPSRLLLPSSNALLRLLGPGRYLPRVQSERRIAWMLGRELELAAKALAEAEPAAIVQKTQDLFDKCTRRFIWESLRDSARWQDVADSVRALGQASPEVGQTLLAALGYGDSDVRSRAVDGLGQLGQASPEVVQALLAALGGSDSSVRVRVLAARSLGQLGQASPEVVQALSAALGDNDQYVRAGAASSLGELGRASPEVVQALRAALGGSDSSVRVWAARSLGELGQVSPEVVQALLTTLNYNNRYEWKMAAEGLDELGWASPAVVQVLRVALGDNSRYVRAGAAWSLGKLGQSSPEVVQALLITLGDRDPRVRTVAAEGLGELGGAGPEVVQALRAALSDSDSIVRRMAAWSLGELGRASPEVVQALRDALGDNDSSVRAGAARSLGQLGQASPEVVQAFRAALADSDDWVGWRAAKSLSQLGWASPEVVQALRDALGDNDQYVRAGAASSLGELGQSSPEVVKALLAALADRDLRVRTTAAEALGELGRASPEVVQALLAVVGNWGSSGQRRATDTLKSFRIEDGEMLSRVLAVLNCKMHDIDLGEQVRGIALNAARRLLEGRPLPGYHWAPIGKR